jgi:hypothetical protein
MAKRVAVFLLLIPALLFASEQGTAFIYYYAWYGNPDYDGTWIHWNENNHYPPQDVSSAFFPKLGPYSSRDPVIIRRHMQWISEANINVILYSWWGRGDVTDELAQSILDAAAEQKLKVSFLIEPYPGRTPHRICDDIEYLNHKFEKHPAYYRTNQTTAASMHSRLRGLFLIFDPDYSDHQIAQFTRTVHESSYDSLIVLQSTDASLLDRTGADGIFAYEAFQPVADFYPGIAKAVKQRNGIFIPAVSPGFNINRTFGERSSIHKPRRKGKTYDEWWERVLAAEADYVAILTFNEWHEGTQIEPARQIRSYISYEDAYGSSGLSAEKSYLRRTARWIHIFKESSKGRLYSRSAGILPAQEL